MVTVVVCLFIFYCSLVIKIYDQLHSDISQGCSVPQGFIFKGANSMFTELNYIALLLSW